MDERFARRSARRVKIDAGHGLDQIKRPAPGDPTGKIGKDILDAVDQAIRRVIPGIASGCAILLG